MKVLFLATYGDFLATFEYSNISILKELGCTIHCASNFSNEAYNLKTSRLDDLGVIRHEIEFARSPFNKKNFSAFKQLFKIIKTEKIDIIDCHNAVVGAFSRVAAAFCGVKKIIYTPHSFFFYKGCPRKNRILYKIIESILARKTDLLITINQEDYVAATKMKTRGKSIYVPGIGLDLNYTPNHIFDKEKFCDELGIPKDSKIFLSVGELNENKNHITAIESFKLANVENAVYLICGIGEKKDYLEDKINSLGLNNRVMLLGYRNDVREIMSISDVFVFPSYREGLSVALMEAMSSGLTCIVSKIRGNVDLIDNNKGGYLFDPSDKYQLASAMQKAIDPEMQKRAVLYNTEKIKKFSTDRVRTIMKKEYKEIKELVR